MADSTAIKVRSEPVQVIRHDGQASKFEVEQRMAKLFAMSGCFSDIKGTTQEQGIAQAYVKIALGGSMGFTPAESMIWISLIQGRPAIGAHLRAARMQAAGFSWQIVEHTEQVCKLKVFRGDQLLGESSFSVAEANRAKLGGKDNWTNYPKNMLFARAITNAQRWYAPGVLSADMLSTEEAADIPAERKPYLASEFGYQVPQRKSAAADAAQIESEIVEQPKREEVPA